ncbi:hypothetical protein KP509_14G082600 [Ceratopteris richardii]|uniref:RING-type domain-containing protein n=1 Tax=Ceratopteris richardii TaxID=49495 RepID=A0A8T2TBX2_CERRI|nr:hypothetical protein KP509_14G082600 [Ceratopteris richardii]
MASALRLNSSYTTMSIPDGLCCDVQHADYIQVLPLHYENESDDAESERNHNEYDSEEYEYYIYEDEVNYSCIPASKFSINAMPVVEYISIPMTDYGHCAVCQEPFDAGMDVKEMPCKHIYHSGCIVQWLSGHRSCPLCRFLMPVDDSNSIKKCTESGNDQIILGNQGNCDEEWEPDVIRFPIYEGFHEVLNCDYSMLWLILEHTISPRLTPAVCFLSQNVDECPRDRKMEHPFHLMNEDLLFHPVRSLAHQTKYHNRHKSEVVWMEGTSIMNCN